MTNQVENKESLAITYEAQNQEVMLSPDIVSQYLVSGNATVTHQEIVMFMQLCKFQQLNPFLNEAYLVKFKSKNGPDKPAQIIISKEAFMKRAESHSQYAGIEAGIVIERDGELIDIEGALKLPKDKLIGGWAKVYRKDRERPTYIRISEAEFNKKQSTWNAMPLNMMRKTAVVNALRETFPDNLGALYTEEESNAPVPTNDVQTEIDTNANAETLSFEPEDTPNEEIQTEMLPKEEVEDKPATTTKSKFNDAELGF